MSPRITRSQSRLAEFVSDEPDDLTLLAAGLSDAEREIYVAVEREDVGVREYQRDQGWSSPGTASNLLARARDKLEG